MPCADIHSLTTVSTVTMVVDRLDTGEIHTLYPVA
jgi:hypothetical protein